MPIFSSKSLDKLHECHVDLQVIFKKVIKVYDVTIACGFRNKEEQEDAFKRGASKVRWPNGKHNSFPSMAVDSYPVPFDGSNKADNVNRFYFMAGIILGIANDMYERGDITHKVRWGGDFNRNKVFTDDSFKDLPHFELEA